jgi:hypothetical protein
MRCENEEKGLFREEEFVSLCVVRGHCVWSGVTAGRWIGPWPCTCPCPCPWPWPCVLGPCLGRSCIAAPSLFFWMQPARMIARLGLAGT